MIYNKKPYVLEYNVRMGDPECQPILMRFDSDLLEYLTAASEGRLNQLSKKSWKKQYAVCIVIASKGYPNSYPINDQISGLENIPNNTNVFHAGTKKNDGKIFTNGGRVLGVTTLGETLKDAIENAYIANEKINCESKYFRNDIGKKGLDSFWC